MERFVTSRINNQQFRNQVIAGARSLCKDEVPEDTERARFQIHYKLVASSNALNLDADLLQELCSSDDRLRAIDMESAGFGGACCAAPDQPQWMVIRGVSDFGTPESKKEHRRPIAALSAAILLREFISRGLIESYPCKVDVPEVRKPEISPENYYRKNSFSSFLVDSVRARLGIDLSARRIGSDITFGDLVAICSESNVDPVELRKKLEETRESYFTSKYIDYEDQNDLRQHVPYWDNELHDVYRELGIGLGNCTVLYVGIGTGRDLSRVCAQAARIIGVDVSSAMLEKARKGWPALEAICESAESLSSIQSGSIDLYLSLRTYQSSLFDVEGAVRQAYRVMKPGAGLVISIPNGFVERRGETIEVIRGLLVPNSDRLMDPERPRQIALRITGALSRLGFEEIGIMERKVDTYIRGRKPSTALRNVTVSHDEEG